MSRGYLDGTLVTALQDGKNCLGFLVYSIVEDPIQCVLKDHVDQAPAGRYAFIQEAVICTPDQKIRPLLREITRRSPGVKWIAWCRKGVRRMSALRLLKTEKFHG